MDVSALYEDAVETVQQQLDVAFEPPEIELGEIENGGSMVVPGEYRITLAPSAVDRFQPRTLRSTLAAQIETALTDTVELAVRDRESALPSGYDHGEGEVIERVTLQNTLEDDAMLAHVPATGELRMGAPAVQHIDAQDTAIGRPLSELLDSAVAHAHHNTPLYDHPGFLDDAPYLMTDLDPVDDHIKATYGAAGQRFKDQEEHAIPSAHDPPRLRVTDRVAGSVDLDAGEILMDGRLLDRLDRDRFERELAAWLKAFYDDSLRANLRDRAPAIAARYDHYEPDMAVEEAYFDDLTDATAKHHDHTIRFDRSKMRYFDPINQVFRDHGTRTTGDHELTHELDFGNNPVTNSYWDARATFTGKYTEDYRNAVVEAITTFEQYISGGRRDARAVAVMDEPWRVPGFFDGALAIDEDVDPSVLDWDTDTVTNPYEFGLYAALSVRDGFLHRYGPENAVTEQDENGADGVHIGQANALARDFLYPVTTTPRGLLGAVERSLDMRPTPNYLRTLRVYDEMARDTDDPTALLEPAAEKISGDIAGLGSGTGFLFPDRSPPETEEERALELFYEGSAVLQVHDYRRDRHGNLPQAFGNLRAETSELADRYA